MTAFSDETVLKRNEVLSFDDGLLTIKISGHGAGDGWGSIAFHERQIEIDADGFHVAEIPPSELRALRDFLNRIIPAALSASPVAQESQLLTLLDAATVALQGLIERPGDDESWGEANKLLPKLLSRLERRGDECCAHGVELHQDCYRCDEGPPAPVAQEPVATKATQQASSDFLHEEMIKLGSPLTYTACLTLTKRITDTNTLAWAGEVNKLCTEIGSLKNEIAALKSAASPPATSAGVGADEIAQIIATKCFDPRVIDSSGKPFWKKSQWREAQQAANAILALLSRAGDQKRPHEA